MTIFKRIDIDLDKERARINRVKYTSRQKKVLHQLVDLFEAGEWQKCLDFVNDKKNFPYNEKGEYPEVEHIGIEIGDILQGVAYNNYYTSGQLLKEAREKIKLEIEKT